MRVNENPHPGIFYAVFNFFMMGVPIDPHYLIPNLFYGYIFM